MNKLKKQNITIALIKDHLINIRLINGLNALGLNADVYAMNLGQTVFDLMGFRDNRRSDDVFEYYLTLIQQVNKINITKQPHLLDKLAGKIYVLLEIKKAEI